MRTVPENREVLCPCYYLVILQKVAWFKREQQRHVVIFGMLAMDVVGFILQQPARLVHHPVRRMDGYHYLANLLFYVNSDIELSFRGLSVYLLV